MAARRKKSTKKSGGRKRSAKKKRERHFTWPTFTWPQSWTRRNVRLASVVAMWIVTAGGVSVTWAVGVPKLQTYAADHSSASVIEIEFPGAPAWINGDLAARLELTAQHNLSPDPLDRHGLVRAREALLNTGWFESVDQVRRVAKDRVVVEATYVQPFTVVRDAEGYHLVDPRGKLLPRSYPPGTESEFIAITGAQFRRPAHPGLQWEGSDITAGLRLVRLIEPMPWREQISAIDVSAFHTNRELVLISDRGARLIWGSPPGEEINLEAMADHKLAKLTSNFNKFLRVDLGHTGTLDLTGSRVTNLDE